MLFINNRLSLLILSLHMLENIDCLMADDVNIEKIMVCIQYNNNADINLPSTWTHECPTLVNKYVRNQNMAEKPFEKEFGIKECERYMKELIGVYDRYTKLTKHCSDFVALIKH